MIQGQSKTIKYNESDWKPVKSKEKAPFYRVMEYDVNNLLTVPLKDYYISGEL